jgi:hypothetical protein
MPFEYKHEARASESFFFEFTHSLALRACITDLFAYIDSMPKETEKRDAKTRASGRYDCRSAALDFFTHRVNNIKTAHREVRPPDSEFIVTC